MALKWFCDVTGKEVFMAPPFKVVTDDKGKNVTVKTKVFNGNTGKVDLIDSPKLEYQKEKAFLVRLSVGDENIQLCLSKEGLDKIKGPLALLWNLLEDQLPK